MVNTLMYGSAMNDRLTPSDWIDHGLRTLADEGPGALKIAPMAAKLNVSRGSFYWHFRDIADYREQLLNSWQERTTERVIRDIEARAAEPDRLPQLLRRAFAESGEAQPIGSLQAAEEAIRSWAAQDKGVAATVASVDRRRIAYIARLLIAAGVEDRKAPGRATFLYWAYLGQAIVMCPDHSAIAAEDIEDISTLFER